MERPHEQQIQNFRNSVENSRQYLNKVEKRLAVEPDNPKLQRDVNEARAGLQRAEQRLASVEETLAAPEIIRRGGNRPNYFGREVK